ncbi:MAG: chromate resistance protein [Thermoplasmatales archaeon]
MKWVTREKAKVDRIACPWLISRFIDKNPEFIFVPKDHVLKVAKEQNAIPFDTPGAELHHFKENDREYVSFDAIIKKYGLKDPALLELAKIVRSADVTLPDPEPEGAGLEAAAIGFRLISADDRENMKLQFPLYDALYAYCKWKIKEGGKLEHSKSK